MNFHVAGYQAVQVERQLDLLVKRVTNLEKSYTQLNENLANMSKALITVSEGIERLISLVENADQS